MEELAVTPGTKLEQALKLGGLVSTGGEAKLLIQDEQVAVNGHVETRRGYKVKDGDIISLGEESLKISLR